MWQRAGGGELALNTTSCLFWLWSRVMPAPLAPLFVFCLVSLSASCCFLSSFILVSPALFFSAFSSISAAPRTRPSVSPERLSGFCPIPSFHRRPGSFGHFGPLPVTPGGQGGGCCWSSPASVSSLLTVLRWEVAPNKRAPNPSVWFHPIIPSQWEGSFLLSLCCRFLTHHTRGKKRLWCLPSP